MASLLLAAPLLMAPKCFDYDGPPPVPDTGTPDTGPADTGTIEAGTDAAPPDTGPPFVPATPCPMPGTAAFLVRNLQYQIVCGCAEAEGKECTVPAGTTVIWNFADAVEHNVNAVEDGFSSPDRLSGRHVHTFEEPGSFGYGCTLHPGAMSGYSLVVQ
jgi:hypothetical protein